MDSKSSSLVLMMASVLLLGCEPVTEVVSCTHPVVNKEVISQVGQRMNRDFAVAALTAVRPSESRQNATAVTCSGRLYAAEGEISATGAVQFRVSAGAVPEVEVTEWDAFVRSFEQARHVAMAQVALQAVGHVSADSHPRSIEDQLQGTELALSRYTEKLQQLRADVQVLRARRERWDRLNGGSAHQFEPLARPTIELQDLALLRRESWSLPGWDFTGVVTNLSDKPIYEMRFDAVLFLGERVDPVAVDSAVVSLDQGLAPGARQSFSMYLGGGLDSDWRTMRVIKSRERKVVLRLREINGSVLDGPDLATALRTANTESHRLAEEIARLEEHKASLQKKLNRSGAEAV